MAISDGMPASTGTTGTQVSWKSEAMAARRKARYAADRRLQIYGMIAIAFALGFLATLVGTLIYTGSNAFRQSMVTIDIDFSTAEFDRENPMRCATTSENCRVPTSVTISPCSRRRRPS